MQIYSVTSKLLKILNQAKNNEKDSKELIKTTIIETKSKEAYQKLINKIGMKLADDANGVPFDKNMHTLALQEITATGNWDLAVPALDRVITQTNDKDAKKELKNIKKSIKEMLKEKQKQDTKAKQGKV